MMNRRIVFGAFITIPPPAAIGNGTIRLMRSARKSSAVVGSARSVLDTHAAS
jgi:hypothetical protein